MTDTGNSTSTEICDAFFASTRNFSLGSDPYEFRTTNVIANVHETAIRFGRTSNISVLYNDDVARSFSETSTDDAKMEYVTGVLMTSILIFTFVMVWFMVIITLKFLGPQRVGMLSGKHYHPTKVLPPNNSNDDNDTKDAVNVANQGDMINDNDDAVDAAAAAANNAANDAANNADNNDGENNRPRDSLVVQSELNQKYHRRLIWTRIVVLCCSVGIAVCVILNILAGIRSLQQASQDVVAGLEKSESLANEAVTIIENFVERQLVAFDQLQIFLDDVNNICPKLTDEICTSLNTSSTCNFTGIPLSFDFQAAFESAVDTVQSLPQVLEESDGMTSDLEALGREFADAADNISSFSWAFGVASFFSVLLLIMNLGISYGIIAAWRQEYLPPKEYHSCQNKLGRIVRHNLMVPIFCVLVVISWMFSMIFVIGSITSSDLCYGSPDDTVLDVLRQDVLPLSSTLQKLAIFYIEGCPEIDISDKWEVDFNVIFNYTDKIKLMRDELRDTDVREILVDQCGTNPETLDAGAAAVEITLCNVGSTFVDIVSFMSCPNWRPLYRLVAYDAVCVNGNEGFYFVALTQFLVVVFAMIMVTLRVAFRPEIPPVTVEEVEKDNQDDENAEEIVSSPLLNEDTMEQKRVSAIAEPELRMPVSDKEPERDYDSNAMNLED